ncbi:MAG TPA: lamin tail domain-containing protein, partial [Candidatus Thalassarchaeaceae archaeon]|nr:lamin tail domain-containing protein [Candidatus Thalassarchaeaceae archaeon]
MMAAHRVSRLAAILLTTLFVASTTTGYGLGLNPLTDIPVEADTQGRTSACVGDVCISEVLVNAFGAETDTVGPSDWTSGEWVEIHNAGTTSVDLASWTLHDHYQRALPMATTNIVYPSSATSFTVAAGDYIVLARNGDGGACGMCLKNTNGVVELLTPSGTLVHSVTWTLRPTEGSTLIEDASNPNGVWIESAAITPGTANGGSSSGPTYYDTGIRVREVLADPFFSDDNASWPGGEWLELENIGASTVDLLGYYIMDSSSNNISLNESHLIGFDATDSTSTHIHPGSRRVVAINSTSEYGVLNNGGDQLAVFASNGSVTDELTYPSVRVGHSKIRSVNGLTWTDALFPT